MERDEFLFRQFKKGDEKAFEHFYETLFPSILGFCIQFIRDEQQSHQITQESFINLWLSKEKIKKTSGIKSFLYTAAKSKCLNYLRHKNVTKKYSESLLYSRENELNLSILQSLDFDSLTVQELKETIDNCIEKLPERTRTVFKLKRFQAKTNAEIAEELHISVKTVESHYTQAKRALKEQLREYFPQVLIGIVLSYF